MRVFKFKLQNVLNARRRIRDRHAARYRSTLHEIQNLQRQFTDLKTKFSQVSETPISMGTANQTIDSRSVLETQRYRAYLYEQMQMTSKQLKTLEEQAAQSQSEMQNAERAYQALDHLRQIHLDHWRATNRKVQQTELDEVGSRTHLNRSQLVRSDSASRKSNCTQQTVSSQSEMAWT